MGLCKAIVKKTGLKCSNKEKESGYCGVHLPKTLKKKKTNTEAFDDLIDNLNKLKIKSYKNSLLRPTKRKST
jgi:hypothetical protein